MLHSSYNLYDSTSASVQFALLARARKPPAIWPDGDVAFEASQGLRLLT